MAHLASRHGIGLLIIDEVQHLSLSKSGGSDKMLNFFVTLVNTIGIPVLMVGTNKAISILQSEFRQARRGSGQGDMVWSQMPKDESWDLFVEGMWEYQWTTNFTELTSEFSYLLYEESQGFSTLPSSFLCYPKYEQSQREKKNNETNYQSSG